MPYITLPAHFDGEQICLDEEYELKPQTKLMVTVLPMEQADEEHESWGKLSAQMLENAYGNNEPEYPASMIKEPNPKYLSIH